MSNNYPRRQQVYTEMSRLSRWYEKQDLGGENPPQIEDKYSRCDISEAAEILEQTACDRLSLLLSWSLESSCSTRREGKKKNRRNGNPSTSTTVNIMKDPL